MEDGAIYETQHLLPLQTPSTQAAGTPILYAQEPLCDRRGGFQWRSSGEVQAEDCWDDGGTAEQAC